MKEQRSKYYLLIAPAVLSLVLWYYIPVLQSFWLSLFDWDGIATGKFLGLDNYLEVLQDSAFWTSLLNMVIVLVFSLTIPLFMPFVASELIHELRSRRLRDFFRMGLVLPVVVPSVVWILLWRNIYDPSTGLINIFVRAVSNTDFVFNWLNDPRTALGALLFIGFPFVSNTALLIFSARLDEVPQDVYDAAKIDGLNTWQRIWFIDLPYCIPQFRFLIVTSFSAIVANYTAVLLLTQGRPLNGTLVPGYYLYRASATDQRFGLAAAVGLMLIVFILVLTALMQKYLKSPDLEHEAK